MSFSSNGVKFKYHSTRRGFFLRWIVKGGEAILSVLFAISLAAPIIFPQDVNAALGASKILSYQGRLTDTNGIPSTGSFCFNFSIYTAASAGTKVWPTGTPSTMSSTVTNGIFNLGIGDTVAGGDSLVNSNWNASYPNGFADIDTTYLNIDVASRVGATCTPGDGAEVFETLTPRQRIDAVAYARVAEGVYGDLLKTDTTNRRVQVGQSEINPVLLLLGIKNTADATLSYVGQTCSVNGTMWYNSASTRALSCVNNVVVGVDNASEIAGIKEQSAGSAIASGVVNFSGSNNITISQTGSTLQFSVPTPVQGFGMSNIGNTLGTSGTGTGTIVLVGGNNITLSQATAVGGRTITISAGAGGGGAALQGSGTYSQNTGTVQFGNSNGVTFGLSNNGVMTASVAAGGGGGGFTVQDFANISWRAFITNVTNMTAVSQRPIFTPFVLPGSLTWNMGNIEVSRATSGSNLFTAQLGIYSFVNATQLSLMGSLQNTYSNTATASISGIRRMQFTGMGAGATALTPGHYVMGMNFSAAATASMNYSLRGGQTIGPPVGNFAPGANQNSTATSQLSSVPMAMFLGRYTATSAALPNTVGFSQVQHHTSLAPIYFYLRST